ncbi:hypothetical protein BU17DRAFT_99292 [Hysterangium stoloniferum]|nr:hypothetical protein BU17DRAFT_99292 [Hysterangium stoloniferum]
MQSTHASGIVSTADNGNATWLPLISLAAHIFITDVSSRTILSQTYIHNGPNMLAEAYYVFPVPARAAVCSFKMQTDDGVTLTGVVKNIKDAVNDYEEARSENRLAGLLEQYQQDIFVVSIGSLQPKTAVLVMISASPSPRFSYTYVMDLSDNDQDDTIRYQLSSYVGGRYGAPSTSVLYPIQGTAHRAGLSITVDIQMSGPILDVQSIGHNLIDMPLPRNRRNSVGGTFHVARKQYNSDNVCLNQDFVVIVQAMDLDVSRCFAERRGSSTALSLTIVPRFQSTTSRSQEREYIFLIDRSGSMDYENKINMAKETLLLLLQSLPAGRARFNIHSFGDTFSSLWAAGSCQYNENFFDVATRHVRDMQADMGGTQLIPALQNVISKRNRGMPTSVFVLTDGWIYDHQTPIAIACVKQASQAATVSNPFRLFTLGIGSDASTELCEGLANAGNGECFMTTNGEDISAKCFRILDAMETPDVKNLAIDWGIQPRQVQQAPFEFSVTPNKRLSVTAILPRGCSAPSHVTLNITLSDDSTQDYRVQVTPAVPLRPSLVEEVLGVPVDLPPLIHTLAAHRLILDYERAFSPPSVIPGWHTLTPNTRKELVNDLIVQLGVRFQITSSRTAFIATSAPAPRGRRVKPPGRNNGSSDSFSTSSASSDESSSQTSLPSSAHKSSPKTSPSNNGSHRNTKSSDTSASHKTSSKNGGGTNHTPPGSAASNKGNGRNSQNSPPSSPGASRMPGAFKSSPPSWQRDQSPNSNNVPSAFFFQANSTEPDELLYLFGGNVPPVLCIAPPLKHELVFVSWFKSLTSFLFRPRNKMSNQALAVGGQMAPPATVNNLDDPAFRSMLNNLGDLQSLEGLYNTHDIDRLSLATGIPPAQIRNLPSEVSSTLQNVNDPISVWATAIAVAFLREKFPSRWVTWKGLVRKSIGAGSRACGGDAVFNGVVTHAVALFH